MPGIVVRQAEKRTTLAFFNYLLRHQPLGHIRSVLDWPTDPAYARVADKVDAWPRDRLWLCVGADRGGAKRCLRERARRRVRAAFEESLRFYGYDRRGRSLWGGRGGLTGSLRIQPEVPGPALDLEMPAMAQAMGTVVRHIEAAMREEERKSAPRPLSRSATREGKQHASASLRPSRMNEEETLKDAPASAGSLTCDF